MIRLWRIICAGRSHTFSLREKMLPLVNDSPMANHLDYSAAGLITLQLSTRNSAPLINFDSSEARNNTV